MSKENIFSWREYFRKKEMSPAERAEWFYKRQLIPHLSLDIATAERERKAKNHQQVNQIFESWTDGEKDQKILTKLRKRGEERKINLTPQENLIKTGFAGLGRIQHVDVNKQLKEERNQRDSLLPQIEKVNSLYQRLRIETLVPWTIHQGSIIWPSEIGQDRANTQEKIGEKGEAIKILTQAAEETFNLLAKAEKEADLETPEPVLKRVKPEAWEQRKIYLGALSSFGVILARRARITKNLPELTLGLAYVNRAARYESNPERLSIIALWTIKGALDKDFEGKITVRARALALASLSLGKATLEKRVQ